ncbi:MAG TPA: plastocyanin/azurin family copper-binding protein [Dehalococcoidia bacterium]|nr:plastocyanin/azurin family copper-binding protein [Dehalococcoidia bacterium]
MTAWKAAAVVMLVATVVGAGGFFALGHGGGQAAYELQVTVGGVDGLVSAEVFGAGNVTINAGDTVSWTNSLVEPHTVTFLANKPVPADFEAPVGPTPWVQYTGGYQISSGFLVGGAQYSVQFVIPGKYHYVCVIHPGMEADVTVQAANSAGTTTQADSNAQFAQRVPPALATGKAALAALPKATSVTKADGTTTWTMGTGASLPVTGGTVDVMAFNSPQLTIKTGDTVVWQANPVPHTITFNGGGNPFIPTTPRQNFDGTGYVNGIISLNPMFTPSTSFSLTFTKAGTYSYICLLHAPLGMAGVITVTAGGLSAPSTGDGGLLPSSDGGGSYALQLAMLAPLALAGAAGVWKLSRR